MNNTCLIRATVLLASVFLLVPVGLSTASTSMITLELLKQDRSFVKLNGIVGYGDFNFSSSGGAVAQLGGQREPEVGIYMKSLAINGQYGTFYSSFNAKCPTDELLCAVPARFSRLNDADKAIVEEYCSSVDPETAKTLWVQFANSRSGYPQVLKSGTTPKPPSVVTSVSYGCTANHVRSADGGLLSASQSLVSPESITVVDPSTAPPNASICTLTSLPSFSFMASKFDVTGTRRSETLHVQCAEGVPQNYTIRLLATSTSSTGGRLLFNSGVSAQISLNGRNIEANGEKHVFPNLTTTDILLVAELVGSSSDFGVSSATGVLILEIQ